MFGDDGSRTQIYRKKTDDGEQVVTLVKNITESGVMVFSDIPLPSLRKGGIILYLRDLPWMIAFAALYWVGYPVLLSKVPQIEYRLTTYGLMPAAALIFALISRLSHKAEKLYLLSAFIR